MNSNVKPLSPEELVNNNLPDYVIIVINKLLKEIDLSKTYHYLYEKNILKAIKAKELEMKIEGINEIIHNHYLKNMIELYKTYGWNITYDRHAYNECYDAYYIFSAKDKK
jgi:hypothetical protein